MPERLPVQARVIYSCYRCGSWGVIEPVYLTLPTWVEGEKRRPLRCPCCGGTDVIRLKKPCREPRVYACERFWVGEEEA